MFFLTQFMNQGRVARWLWIGFGGIAFLSLSTIIVAWWSVEVNIAVEQPLNTIHFDCVARSVAVSPDGEELLATLISVPGEFPASKRPAVKVCPLSGGEETTLLRGVDAQTAAYSPIGDVLAIGVGNEIRIVNRKSHAELFRVSANVQEFRFVAISRDGNWLAAAESDAELYIWNIPNRSGPFVIANKDMQFFAFLNTSNELLVVKHSTEGEIWSIPTLQRIASIPPMTTNKPSCVGFATSQSGNQYAVASVDGTIGIRSIIDRSSDTEFAAFPSNRRKEWMGISLCFAGDDKALVASETLWRSSPFPNLDSNFPYFTVGHSATHSEFRIFDTRDWRQLRNWRSESISHQLLSIPGESSFLEFSPLTAAHIWQLDRESDNRE